VGKKRTIRRQDFERVKIQRGPLRRKVLPEEKVGAIGAGGQAGEMKYDLYRHTVGWGPLKTGARLGESGKFEKKSLKEDMGGGAERSVSIINIVTRGKIELMTRVSKSRKQFNIYTKEMCCQGEALEKEKHLCKGEKKGGAIFYQGG